MAPTRYGDAPVLSGRARAVIVALIVAAHVLLGFALVRAFGGVRALADAVGLGPVLTATVVAPQPAPPTRTRTAEGASGVAARRAMADQIVAPPARLPVAALSAPPVAGSGNDTRSGASAAGEGTGGAGTGTGTGSGGTGQGTGGHYVATRPVKIAGDLAEADYDKAGRAKRLGTSVIVLLTVGTDGQVNACRVHQPSGDPDADAVTCRLALERFRFQPARDQNGDPVEATYGWQQRFFWR